jgi:hypothetical protein
MRGIQYAAALRFYNWRLGVLDRPLEPVIGLAKGKTRWRAMTTWIQFSNSQDDRHCERERSNPWSNNKGRVDCFVASLLAMTAGYSA